MYCLIFIIIFIYILFSKSSYSEHLTNFVKISHELLDPDYSYKIYTYIKDIKYYLNTNITKELVLDTEKKCDLLIKPIETDNNYFMLINDFFALNTTSYSLQLTLKGTNDSNYKFKFNENNKITINIENYNYYLAINVLNELYYDLNSDKGLEWFIERC